MAKFTANNVLNMSMGYLPFYAQAGDNPIVPHAFRTTESWSQDSQVEVL